jgi:hypothetical protein
MNRKLAFTVSALAPGSLMACGEESNTAKPGPDNPATAPTPAQEMSTDAPVPTTATPTAKTSAAFGDTITFPSGVAVKAEQPVTVTAAPKVTYGAQGTAAQNAVDARAGIGMATFSGIRPGETGR